MSSVCRVCRKAKNDSTSFVSLFLKERQAAGSGESTLASMLEFVGSFSVSPEEIDMPQEICISCMGQLRAAYSFRKLCMESDDLFRKQNKPGMVSSANVRQQPSPIQGTAKNSAMYLQNYDPSFYELTLDRYYYMELTFLGPRCCGCRQAFLSEEELQAHSLQEHRKNQAVLGPHQCQTCYSRFPYADALQYHRQAMQRNVFCCRECYLIFEKKHTLFIHLRTEHCRAEYELERDMYEEQHPQMGHSIFDPDPDPEPNLFADHVQSLANPNADPYTMGYCEITSNLKLSDLRSTQYRLTEKTEGFSIIEFTWHRCCACNHMFRDQGDLDVHCTEEHRLRYSQNNTSQAQSKPFLCEFCWRRFKKKSLLGLHQKFNRKKTYSCNTCLHLFFGGPAYEKHLLGCSPSGGQSKDENYVGHQMMAEEPEDEDDDDVYILND